MILLDPSSWEIRETRQKGRGIFATKTIAPGIVFGDYIGKVIRTAVEDTTEKDGLYLLYYHDYASIYPVALTATGMHLVNHSCTPNCWITTYKGHTLFFTLRKIFAGEELTISYLLPPQDTCDPCAHRCICESLFCRGTMHLSKERFKKWRLFNEAEGKRTKRARISYGKSLAKLKDYPNQIPDADVYTLYGESGKTPFELKDKTLPSITVLREHIRQTGKMIFIPALGMTIAGVDDGKLVLL